MSEMSGASGAPPQTRRLPGLDEVAAEAAARAGVGLRLRPSPPEEGWAARARAARRERRPPPDPAPLFAAADDGGHACAIRLALLVADSPDFGPKTLPHRVVERLGRWEGRPPGPHPLAPVALRVASEQKSGGFVALVAAAYLDGARPDAALPLVEELAAKGDYKAACRLCVALRLQARLRPEDVLAPLLFQDRICLIDEYLAGAPETAAPFVAYVDRLLEGRSPIAAVQLFIAERPVSDIKWDRLHHRPLGKLAARLCKKFSLPLDSCENLSKRRAHGGIRFLVRQKYEDDAIGDGAWSDLVVDTVERNPHLAAELVALLSARDPEEAARWASRFGVPDGAAPRPETPPRAGTSRRRAADRRTPRHRLAVPPEGVRFAATADALAGCLRELAGAEVVGVDSEWKPSFGAKATCVSLVQIATADRVHVLDAIALNAAGCDGLWAALAADVLDDPAVVKVGFGLANDVREIGESIPALGPARWRGRLEIGRLWRVAVDSGVVPPHRKTEPGEGLASIVEQCFGTRLDKDEQCSNWENRPLRPSQLEYAALDAHVLVEIYQAVRALCSAYAVDFEEVRREAMTGQSKTKKPKQKYSEEAG